MTQPAPQATTTSTPAATASTAEHTRKSFGRYRVMAFVTGVMLLVLVAEMLLKYVFQLPWVDSALGWVPFVHGWIYVVYIITAFDVWSKARWGLGRLLIMVAGGVVPVLSFVVEARAKNWPVAVRPARTAR